MLARSRGNLRLLFGILAAAGGTVFLDEIGELAPAVQVKLLRVLQDREFTRLGSAKPQKADVRIVAATNRDLEKAVSQGSFRADLYFRLNVIRISLPPLRERKEDILPLVDLFLMTFAKRERKAVTSISAEAMAALLAYDYPGNVRELENAVERAVVFADGDADPGLQNQDLRDQPTLIFPLTTPPRVELTVASTSPATGPAVLTLKTTGRLSPPWR